MNLPKAKHFHKVVIAPSCLQMETTPPLNPGRLSNLKVVAILFGGRVISTRSSRESAPQNKLTQRGFLRYYRKTPLKGQSGSISPFFLPHITGQSERRMT